MLILNENSLSEGERAELQRFGEKVFNRSFKFLPTPTDAGLVVFTAGDDLTRQLRDACEELGIVNIRVLEKLKQFATELSVCLDEVDSDISKNVIRSLVVIVWSMISPAGEGAPGLSYLVDKRGKQSFAVEPISTSAEEDRWGVLLDAFGFASCDDFISLFRSARGDDRRSVILGCLEPRKFINATDRQRSIVSKATAALVSIGRESPLNAHRLAAFQVRIPEKAKLKVASVPNSDDDPDE